MKEKEPLIDPGYGKQAMLQQAFQCESLPLLAVRQCSSINQRPLSAHHHILSVELTDKPYGIIRNRADNVCELYVEHEAEQLV